MEEQLQSLLTRIHSEGVEKAEIEAAEIVSAAQAKARAIVSAAEQQAVDVVAAAERESLVFTERSRQKLDQVARDFLIGVQNSVEALLAAGVKEAVGEALTPETMVQMVTNLAEAYGANDLRENRIELLVSPRDQEEFMRLALGSYQEKLGRGVEIRPVRSIHKGFMVSISDGNLYHDFTQEALAASLAQLLKSPLKEIVEEAAATETPVPGPASAVTAAPGAAAPELLETEAAETEGK